MSNGVFQRPGVVFALIYAWKILLFAFTVQPVPSNDAFFYDGPVVNLLLHGKYANPSLALALPISGTEVFCAYPPVYQLALLGWMALAGTSALAAMGLHLVLLGVYMLLLLAILRRLAFPFWAINVAGAFLLVITFHDRPDSLAHVFGIAAFYAWLRSLTTPGIAQSLRGSAWHWLMVLLLWLSVSTGLQIGAVYFLLAMTAILGARLVLKEPLPMIPLLALFLVPLALVGLLIAGRPRLWQGFLEHAHQTPSWTGLRIPRMNEWLKIIRTVPGLLLAAGFLGWVVAKGPATLSLFSKTTFVATLSATMAALAIVGAAAFVLTPNSVFFGAYLQPLAVAGCLTIGSDVLKEGRCRAVVWIYLLAALLGSIRAIGLSTWGVACAADVSYADAIRIVRRELEPLPQGQRVGLSSAYLYEAARHRQVQWLHSDWLARGESGRADFDRAALLATRPAELILTQFDFYRRYQPTLDELKNHPELAGLTIVDSSKVRPPDAHPALQRVVQHVSWAPVIVKLSWRQALVQAE